MQVAKTTDPLVWAEQHLLVSNALKFDFLLLVIESRLVCATVLILTHEHNKVSVEVYAIIHSPS